MQDALPNSPLLKADTDIFRFCNKQDSIQNLGNELTLRAGQPHSLHVLRPMTEPVNGIDVLDNILHLHELSKPQILSFIQEINSRLPRADRPRKPVILADTVNYHILHQLIQRTSRRSQIIEEPQQFILCMSFVEDNKLLRHSWLFIKRIAISNSFEETMPLFFEVAPAICRYVMRKLIKQQLITCKFTHTVWKSTVKRSRNLLTQKRSHKPNHISMSKVISFGNCNIKQPFKSCQNVNDNARIFLLFCNKDMFRKQEFFQTFFHIFNLLYFNQKTGTVS